MVIKRSFVLFSFEDFRRSNEFGRDGRTLSPNTFLLWNVLKVTKLPLLTLLPIGTPVLLVYVYLLTKKRITPDYFCCCC